MRFHHVEIREGQGPATKLKEYGAPLWQQLRRQLQLLPGEDAHLQRKSGFIQTGANDQISGGMMNIQETAGVFER